MKYAKLLCRTISGMQETQMTDCCITHNCIKSRCKFWRLKISYMKSKFTKCGKIALLFPDEAQNKQSLNMGFHYIRISR
jgi:hypothetical protein